MYYQISNEQNFKRNFFNSKIKYQPNFITFKIKKISFILLINNLIKSKL